ncbi:MAG: amidase [Acidimicrobiia bacterium]|nr:amidase [Acidimicrobiia bacterium]
MTTTPWTIESAGAALRAGTVSSVELVRSMLDATGPIDDQLGVYLARFDDTALAAAERADTELAAGTDRGPLHGIPLGIKDILATDEGPTTCQSVVLPPSWGDQGDGPVLRRLREAGGIVMGKTTTMEFAVGRPDPSKPFPVPANPWDPERWTGGSSSGSGSGVAAGLFLGALGTDTGGSVRVPAAYCGITGHKPTHGLVPKSGCFPLGYTFDNIGPMCRSVWDCAAMLTVMAGADPSDRTTVAAEPADYVAELARDGGSVAGMRVGVIGNESVRRHSGDATWAALDEALAVLRAAGVETVPVEVPLYDELHCATFLGLQAEAYAYHRNWLVDRWEDYGRPTRLTLAMGAMISGGDLAQIERVRQAGRQRIAELMDGAGLDALASPTMGYGATKLRGAARETTSVRAMHCPPWNGTGFPALALPMGFDGDGLPLSLQLIARPFADTVSLRLGHAFQQETDWHLRVAPLHAAL